MTLISSLLLCLSAVSFTMAAPLGAGTYRMMPRQSNGTAIDPALAQAFDANQALAAGISLNVMAQQGEIAALQNMQLLEASPVNDPSEFQAAKANLMGFLMLGMNIRQNNQAIAPAGNPALDGLANVALAQQSEMTLINSLTGDPTNDAPIIQRIGRSVSRSGNMNTQNQNAATFLKTVNPNNPLTEAGLISATPKLQNRAALPEIGNPLF